MTNQEAGKVARFFHQISPQVLQLVNKKYRHSKVVKHKSKNKNDFNFATEADLAVEKLIILQIQENFPKDQIMAEESYAETKLGKLGKLWVIDPICGTGNFARDIKTFVTNIALVENGKLVAACAIDHPQSEYIWSTGQQKVFSGKKLLKREKKTNGVAVEVDLTALLGISREIKQKHAKLISQLILKTDYYLVSTASSLNFAYVALGRLDAYVCANCKLWDMAASNFLILQAGGVVTDIFGKEWTINSSSALASIDKKLHGKLLNFLN